MEFVWLKSGLRLKLVVFVMILAVTIPVLADDSTQDATRDKLAIPGGIYTLEKGDVDCEGTTAEVQYASVEKNISLILGAKYIFANFNRPSFTESVNSGEKQKCTVTTTTSVSTQLIESKTVQSCKLKSENYQQTQKLKFTGKQLIYEFERNQAWDTKPTKLHCEYRASSVGPR